VQFFNPDPRSGIHHLSKYDYVKNTFLLKFDFSLTIPYNVNGLADQAHQYTLTTGGARSGKDIQAT
jgi:hypothetical protein